MAVITTLIPANCTITLIQRPVRSGVGGDSTLDTLLESAVPAIREPFNAFAISGNLLLRDDDRVSVSANNTFWIDLMAPGASAFRQVNAGDLITWVSTRQADGGPASDPIREEVGRTHIYEAVGFQREHIEIFTVGQGAS